MADIRNIPPAYPATPVRLRSLDPMNRRPPRKSPQQKRDRKDSAVDKEDHEDGHQLDEYI